MIFDFISDLHGHYPKLEGGDLLIVAGDHCANDSLGQINRFKDWLVSEGSKYKKTIMLAGNHDNWIQRKEFFNQDRSCWDHPYHAYLEDSGTEFEGLKIWGSPWTKTFEGMNPHCKAFTLDTEEELAEKWALIPDDTDILITHSPSFGNYDALKNPDGTWGPSVGSISLWMSSLVIRPKVHVFGHIHEGYGHSVHVNGIHLINASHVNERYKPVNKPVRIEL